MKYIYSIIVVCLLSVSCGLLPDRTPPKDILKNIGSMTLCDQGFAILNLKGDRVYVLDLDLKKRVNYYYLGNSGYRDICFNKDFYLLHKKTGNIHKMNAKNAEISSVINIEFVLGEKYRDQLPDTVVKEDGKIEEKRGDTQVWINDFEVTGYKHLACDGEYFYTTLPSEIARLKMDAQINGDYKIVQKWLTGKPQGLFYENNHLWYTSTSYIEEAPAVVKQFDLTKTDPLYGWILPAKTIETDCIDCSHPNVKGNTLWLASVKKGTVKQLPVK